VVSIERGRERERVREGARERARERRRGGDIESVRDGER